MSHRPSISVRGEVFDRLLSYCCAEGVSMSSVVEFLIAGALGDEPTPRATGRRMLLVAPATFELLTAELARLQLERPGMTLDELCDGLINRILDAAGAPASPEAS